MGDTETDGRFIKDRAILPKSEFDVGRRTVILDRKSVDEPFGVALQSYVVQKGKDRMERFTYLDCVEEGGIAGRAGITNGDMIIAVNGECVISLNHSSLLSLLSSTLNARLIVLARQHSHTVSLHRKLLVLRERLAQANDQLIKITTQEEELLEKGRNRLRNTKAIICPSSIPSKLSKGILLTKLERVHSQAVFTPQVTRL